MTKKPEGDDPPTKDVPPVGDVHRQLDHGHDDPLDALFDDTMEAGDHKKTKSTSKDSDSLTAHSITPIWRDGLSDKVKTDVAEALTLPVDHPNRVQLIKQLVDKFDKPATYAEKVAAAESLLMLKRGLDGRVPDVVAERDVLLAEKTKWVSGGSGRGSHPSKLVVESPSQHKLFPVKAKELMDFLERSAPEIQRRTVELLKAPVDSPDRKSYVDHLVNVFQTSGRESPEKLAAAKALETLCRQKDGSLPDVLGSRDVVHPATTKTVSAGRGTRTVTDKEAYSEKVSTTAEQVLGYLDTRADGLLTRTQDALKGPENESQRKKILDQALKTFLDSSNSEDRTAAAIALLELNRKPDGSINDTLGARQVAIPAETKYIPGISSGRNTSPGRHEVIKPASERTETVKADDVVRFLQLQANDALSGSGRLVAADVLQRANKITEADRNTIYEKVLTDANSPEQVKQHVRALLGRDKEELEVTKVADGRREKPEEKAATITISDQTRQQLSTTFDALLPAITVSAGADGTAAVLPETIKAMKEELKNNQFGPATRAVYNHCAAFLNDATTGMATALISRNVALPAGCPISVPHDISGRAQNDQLFKEGLKSGQIKMDLKPVGLGEAPSLAEAARMTATGEWATKAIRQIDSTKLHWQVKVFDENIEAFNSKDDKLKAWKSHEGMTDKQLEQLQASRGEWLGMALQVRNYAHTIASYNKASSDSVKTHQVLWGTMATSITGTDSGIFSDKALESGVFPGTVTRKDGKITAIELDLPKTLDRDDPVNLQKMEKIRQWMEIYGTKVDQATTEIAKANHSPERTLLWLDIPAEGKIDGKPYNQLSFRVSADIVRIKDEKGQTQEMIRVVSSKQAEYVPDWSYLGLYADEVGKAQHTGKVIINGQPLEKLGTESSVGKQGAIKIDGAGVEDKQCVVKTDVYGQVFIKDTSENGTFINGKPVSKTDWQRINPMSDSVTFGREPLLDIKTKDGAVTINGQNLDKNMQGISVGKNGPITFDSPCAEANHALVRFDQGKLFIKDTSKSGTFVNGARVSSETWTEIDPAKDKVSLGQAPKMEVESDIRLYKPDDWVTIMLDGKMQIMQAKDINSWTTEAKRWHWGGKAATAAMDIGMVVSGTIELKAALIAAQKTAATLTVKELTKRTALEVLPALLKTEGARRGAFHLVLGLTGFTHQYFENQGEGGKAFNKARGYAMMMDISWNTLLKPAGAKVFGAAKAAEAAKEGSTVAAYLEKAPDAVKLLHKGTEKVFFASNFYFIPEIVSHQLPTIEKMIRGQNSEELLNQGRMQRGAAYSGEQRPSFTEERAMRFASPELQKRVAEASDVAKKTSELKDEDPKKEEQRRKFATSYLQAKNDDDKMVAAVALLKLAEKPGGGYPESLGDMYRFKGGVPQEVKLTNVKNFLASKELDSVNAFDKEAKTKIEVLQKDVATVKDKPENDQARQQANAKFLDLFVNGKTSSDKLAAALSVISLHEKSGALPEVLGRIPDGKGGLTEVRKSQLEEFLGGLNKQFAVDQFERYSNWSEKADGGKLAQNTKAALLLPANDPQRLAQIETLANLVKNSPEAKTQSEAAIALILLSRNVQNGSIPKTLAPGLSSEDVFKKLKGNIAAMPPGLRLAAGDLLYRANQTSLHGQSAVNDLGGVLLSVLKDKNASPELKQQAILNSNGIGLAEIMEKHRFESEPSLDRLRGNERMMALSDLSGRDSASIQNALKGIAEKPIDASQSPHLQSQQRDLKALALATLLANSEPDPAKRMKGLSALHSEYAANQQNAGAYAHKYFERMRDVLSTEPQGTDERAERFRAALALKTSGEAATFGVSQKQLLEVFHDSFRPVQPELALQAIDHVLPHFKELSKDEQDKLMQSISYALKSSAQTGSAEDNLRRELIGRIEEIAKQTNADHLINGSPPKVVGAREIFSRMLTPGTFEYKSTSAESRAAAATAIVQIGSNDLATRTLLKKSLGLDGGTADPSALVRNASFDSLLKLNPPGLRQTCLDLLAKETDPELLRRIKGTESGERRLDPSTQEYKEKFRVALRDLLTLGKERTLVGSEEYIKENFPLLDGPTLRKQEVAGHYDKYCQGFGGFLNWSFSLQSTIDQHRKDEITRVGKEMNGQFEQLVDKAKTDEGDQARRALAWIVMSNGKGFSMAEKEGAVKRAAEGLFSVAESGSVKSKEALAPLLTMCLMTQDRMPYSARTKVLDSIESMKPGTPGSSISESDAGIAILAALRRQFHNTPKVGDPSYAESQDLQLRLLGACEKYMKQEGIPILEAIAESRTKSSIERDAQERVTKVNYADRSTRVVDYDAEGKIWKDTFKSADGKTTTMVREGKSDIWYSTADTEKKNPWRGQPYFDHGSGMYARKDAYGGETITTPSGARAERKDGLVHRVLRADGSSYELLYNGKEPYSTINTSTSGLKTIWNRDGSTDKWYKDTDRSKKELWQGNCRFDANTLDYVETRTDGTKTTISKPDGSLVEFKNGVPFFSKPGGDDKSAHSMPVVRDKAREILSRLRDDTERLRTGTPILKDATSQDLATTLQAVLQRKESTSEDVVKAIFSAGLSKQLSAVDDPRRPVLQQLLNDPHERVQLAAARVLISSAIKEDRERAAEVLVDLQKNASRIGYKQDAQSLITEAREHPERFWEDVRQLLQAASERIQTHAQPREEARTTRTGADRPIDHQEAYEIAKAEMIRDSQRPLSKYSGPEWWKKNGYELLDERNMPAAKEQALKSVEPGLWEFISSWESTLQKKRDDAIVSLNERFNLKIKDLCQASELDNVEGVEAREALSFIVLSQGEPLDPHNRDAIMTVAARQLAKIYTGNAAGAGDVEFTLKAALVSNPNITRDVRSIFANAVVDRFVDELKKKSPSGNMTRSDFGALVVASLESEYMAMPQPGQAGYSDSIKLQKGLLGITEALENRVSLPVVEAISTGHPDEGIRKQATAYFEKMRDSVEWISRQTKPDITTNNSEKAKLLSEVLTSKNFDDEYAVRELFRLCAPASLRGGLSGDPRAGVLQEALNHPNERIKFAAAQILSMGNADQNSLKAVADVAAYTTRPGLKEEARKFLDAAVVSCNKDAVIGIADAVLKHKGESNELLALLRDPAKTDKGPYSFKFPDGREIVVRRQQVTVIEEFKNGKLERHIDPPGKNYAQVLLEDSDNHKLSLEKRAIAARDALRSESFGDLTEAERSRAIRNLGFLVSNNLLNEKTRLEMSKFLGSDASLKGADAATARVQAFDAIVDLAAHGNDTKADSRKIITADASAELVAMRSLSRSLDSLSGRGSEMKKFAEEKLQLQSVLFKSESSEKEALLYTVLNGVEKLVGPDSEALKTAASLLDRTAADHKLSRLTGPDDPRLPGLKLALTSANGTVSASAALALLDPKIKPSEIPTANLPNGAKHPGMGFLDAKTKEVALGALNTYMVSIKGRANDFESASDNKQAHKEWAKLEKVYAHLGRNPEEYAYTFATAKRMAAEFGPTHRDLVPLYERLAKQSLEGQDPQQSEFFQRKAKIARGETDLPVHEKSTLSTPQVKAAAPIQQADRTKLIEQVQRAKELAEEALSTPSKEGLEAASTTLSKLAVQCREVDGAASLHLAATLAQLGTVEMAAGNKTAAEKSWREAISIYEKAGLDLVHEDAMKTTMGLTKFYASAGNQKQFEEFKGKMLNMSRIAGTKEVQLSSSDALMDVADSMTAESATREMAAEAEKFLRTAVELRVQKIGGDTVETAVAQRALADFYMRSHPKTDVRMAQDLYQQSLNAIEKQTGQGFEWAQTRAKLAHCRAQQGDYEGANAGYNQAVDAMVLSGVNQQTPQFKETVEAYAQQLTHVGKLDEANFLRQNPGAYAQMQKVTRGANLSTRPPRQ